MKNEEHTIYCRLVFGRLQRCTAASIIGTPGTSFNWLSERSTISQAQVHQVTEKTAVQVELWHACKDNMCEKHAKANHSLTARMINN